MTDLQEYKEEKTLMDTAQRMANSTLVPAHFRKPENMIVACELAKRLDVDVFSVVNNCYIVNGKPSWSSSFITSLINRCGRYKPLKYKYLNEKNEEVKAYSKDIYGCYAYTTELETGDEVASILITMDMAKQEGWINKSGSKWRTFPAQMLAYRAAAFFGRQHLPEYLNSMYAVEEMEDIKPNAKKIDSEAEALNELFINSDDYEIINEGE